MDLVDLVRIGVRRWYVAVPAGIVVVIASLFVRSSVDLEYKSTGSLLLFAPREAVVAKNRFLAFNSLNVPASVSAQVVSSVEAREKLIALGASGDYEVGLDPSNPAPLVIAVATGSREEAKRTVELVLEEIDADLERRQVALGAPPETWITTEIVTPPTKPVAQAGARTRAFIAMLMVGMAVAAGLTLLVDLLLDRRSGTPRRQRRAQAPIGGADGHAPGPVVAPATPPPPSPVPVAPAGATVPTEVTTPPPAPAPPPVLAPPPTPVAPAEALPARSGRAPVASSPTPPATVPAAARRTHAAASSPPAPSPPAPSRRPGPPPESPEHGGATPRRRPHPYLVAGNGEESPGGDDRPSVWKSETN